MGGVAEQGGPAAVEGRQRSGELGDIVAEYVLRPGGRQQSRDRLVPWLNSRTNSASSSPPVRRARQARPRSSRPARRTAASRRTRCRVPSSPPWERPGHRAGEQAPGGEPRVASPGWPGNSAERVPDRSRRPPPRGRPPGRPAVVTTRAAVALGRAFPPGSTDVTSVVREITPPGRRAASASITAVRGSRMTGSPNRSEIIRPVALRISHRPSDRRMPTSCGTARPRSPSPAPMVSSAGRPLGASARAAPWFRDARARRR